MISIIAENAPDAYAESYWVIKTHGVPQNSRNGPVLAMPGPTFLDVHRPLQRVIFDPERNCNPFFHVMETIWMFAGEDHVGFPARFNSTYVNYAEADGSVHGAYGKRWRDYFQPKEIGPRFRMDQIQVAIAMLKNDPEDRRVVLSMWDATADLGAKKRDLPCNTHIYFRTRKNTGPDLRMGGCEWVLDMTVCNRSNDLLWGMLGANIVHMTYLQELVAFGAEMDVGKYQVFTNNLHVYTDSDVYKRFAKGPIRCDLYTQPEVDHLDLLDDGETVTDFLKDCEDFVHDRESRYKTFWMNNVALPMYQAYSARIYKTGDGLEFVDRIAATDWRIACRKWIERKTQSSVT
jgi:thymidylate synthase